MVKIIFAPGNLKRDSPYAARQAIIKTENDAPKDTIRLLPRKTSKRANLNTSKNGLMVNSGGKKVGGYTVTCSNFLKAVVKIHVIGKTAIRQNIKRKLCLKIL